MRRLRSIFVSCLLLSVTLPQLAFAVCGHLSGDMSAKAIAERIKPIGLVVAEGGAVKSQATDAQPLSANAGEERYKSTCAVCHATGVAGAPKFRNEADWKARASAGMDEMLKIAIQGKGGMPPKGTCMQCSDEELRKTIEYMIPQKK